MSALAEAAGKTPQSWVDETSAYFSDAWSALDISNDDFIRTTEKRHEDAVAKFLQAIYDNGYIYKGIYAGWYCVSCEAYYHEEELEEGHRCPIHGTPAEWLTEENYFFALSRPSEQLTEWYAAVPDAVVPEIRKNEALGLIRMGLEDVSISRTVFDWGVRVPWDKEHVVYVWFDALINYVTAAGYGTDESVVREVVATRPSRHRQGHRSFPLRVVAGDVHRGRYPTSAPGTGARMAARRGGEDVEVEGEPDRPRGARR